MILITGKLAPSSLRLLAKCFDSMLNKLVLDFSVKISSSRVSSNFLFIGSYVTMAMRGPLKMSKTFFQKKNAC